MSVKIQVTQEDIENGVKCNSHHCPVALACLRVINKDWFTVWEILTARNIDPFESENIKRFINSFDANEKVEPFEFELPDFIKD